MGTGRALGREFIQRWRERASRPAAGRCAGAPGGGRPRPLNARRWGKQAYLATYPSHGAPEPARPPPVPDAENRSRKFSAQQQPAQRQSHQPGREYQMQPRPQYEPKFPGVGKLKGKVALITGGDSGIGRAVAVAMAREGAKIAIIYLDEDRDADETLAAIKKEGSEGIKLRGDIAKEEFCFESVDQVIERFGRLDILVNNAAEQHEAADPLDISAAQLQHTFQ